jgi:hypothetical protein
MTLLLGQSIRFRAEGGIVYRSGLYAWRGGWRLAVVAGVAAALLAGPGAWAQELPTANSGPQFGQWGPGRGSPAPETAAPSTPPGGRLGAPAPGAPAPAPAPEWGGCNHYLGGSWSYSGEETQPTAFLYNGQVNAQQYQNWLQVSESQSNGATTEYYGQCNGNNVQFDVYQDGQFVGYQYGNVDAGWRFGTRVSFNWVTWQPGSGTQSQGREGWRRG